MIDFTVDQIGIYVNTSTWLFTLYTVPKAPEPMIPPLLNSDCLMSRMLDMSGLALVGVKGCCKGIKQYLNTFTTKLPYSQLHNKDMGFRHTCRCNSDICLKHIKKIEYITRDKHLFKNPGILPHHHILSSLR